MDGRSYRPSVRTRLFSFLFIGITAGLAVAVNAQETAASDTVQDGVISRSSDATLLGFQKNFVRASLDGKLELLQQIEGKPGMGPLYDQALQFSLQNAELLGDDPSVARLAALAAEGAKLSNSTQIVQTLWKVFVAFRDTQTRVAILRALSELGKGDGQVIENLNQFLVNQNNVNKAGLTPDLEVLSACIDALGTLGDGSSFSVLFSTMIAGYNAQVFQKASTALKYIRGDYKKYLIDVIKKNPPAEKLAAFRAGTANENFLPSERGELAEGALDASLGQYATDPKDIADLLELRYSAVRELTQQKWTKATSLAVKHFYRVQADFTAGVAPKGRFLEAIACLGAMSSSESAQALSLYIGIVNAEMEKTGTFDKEILLGAIDALGKLGDKVAFDYLLFIGYLSYPDDVKTAAREALNRLKW